MNKEFSKENKYILIVVTIFMLLPSLSNMELNIPIMACGSSLVFLMVQLMIKKDKDIFMLPFSCIDLVMLVLVGIGILNVVISLWSYELDEMYGFLILAMAIMYFATRSKWEVTKQCLDFVFYGGLVLVLFALLHFFMNTDILFGIGLRDTDVIGQVALFAGLIGSYIFSIEQNKTLLRFYGVGLVCCILCLELCGNDVILLLFILGICLLVVNAEREEQIIKRLLLCLFLAAFLPCNMVLLVEYTELIKVEVSCWSLQASVVMELIICLVALFVFHYLDKMEEKQEDAIRNMQFFMRSLFRYIGGILIFLCICGWIENKAGMENLLRLFQEADWKPEGIFVSAFLEVSVRMGEYWKAAVNESLLGIVYDAFGWFGLTTLCGVMVIWGNRLWRLRKCTLRMDVLIWILSMLIFVVWVMLPLCTSMLPIYTFFFMKTIQENSLCYKKK